MCTQRQEAALYQKKLEKDQALVAAQRKINMLQEKLDEQAKVCAPCLFEYAPVHMLFHVCKSTSDTVLDTVHDQERA